MKLAIIGVGNVGAGLAAAAAAAGHDVVVSATDPTHAQQTAATTGATAASSNRDAVQRADVVVLASRYADPTEGGQPLDALVAGDDAQAKSTVAALVESLGFRPVDAGRLRMARTIEELAFLNISLNASNGWTWQSAFTLVGPQTAAAP